MIETAPCKDCPDREVGCHSKCSRYLNWKEQNEATKRAKALEREANSYMYENIKRSLKKRRR